MGNFKGDTNSRRIDRALQHVSKPWFPMNPDVVKRVRDGLEAGSFTNDSNALINELKNDFALFTFIVKELSQRAVAEGVSQTVIANPIELIRWGNSGPHLQEVLAEQQKVPNIHSLHWSEPFQIQRLRETAIIASTASVLSEKKNLDPELGFSRGVVREIGLNLIAWNYPTVYSEVFARLQPDQNLDDELSKELGFTPALLAMRLMRPDKGPDATEDEEESTWATYDELCEVGENLARAENPETYPSAENDWQKAKSFLSNTMGEEAISIIRDKAVESSKHYQKSIPEVFGNIDKFDPQKNIEKHKRVSRALEERYLQFCPEAVQKALRELYSELTPDSVNKALVGKLLKDIVPEAGFTGGCVFVVDPSSLSLKRRTLIGVVQMRKISNVALEPGDAALSALSSSQPILHCSAELADDALTGIYSSLGGRKKIGVLYLETPKKAQLQPEDGTMGVFEVIKKALCDALLIE